MKIGKFIIDTIEFPAVFLIVVYYVMKIVIKGLSTPPPPHLSVIENILQESKNQMDYIEYMTWRWKGIVTIVFWSLMMCFVVS
jgi:hypothetical protein